MNDRPASVESQAERDLRVGNEVASPPSDDPAVRAARGILRDLADRKGVIDGVDYEILDEMVKHHSEIIRAAFKEAL